MSFDSVNKTEVLAICEDAGLLNVHREMDDTELAELLTGTISNEMLPVKKSNQDRRKIMRYILAHWESVQPLLSCPARSGSPTACFACSDLQVAYCIDQNPAIASEPEPEEEEENPMANNEFVARTREEWTVLAENTDKQERAKVFQALIHLGSTPGDVMKMTPEQRVEKLMARQEEEGLTPAGAGKKGGAKTAAPAKAAPAAAAKAATAAKPAVGGKKAAAQAPAEEEQSSSGGTVGNAEFERLEQRVEDLQSQLASANEKLDTVSEALENILALVSKDLSFTLDAHAHTKTLFDNLCPMPDEAAENFGNLTLEEGNG